MISRCTPRCLAVVLVGVVAGAVHAATIVPVVNPTLERTAEWRVDGAPVAANNFDPDLICLDAVFTAPSGRIVTVPAFWYRDFERRLVDGAQVLRPAGEAHWRVRFTPREPGTHALEIRVQLGGQDAPAQRIASVRFDVARSAETPEPGWARVAPDRRSFETAAGRPLRLIGANVCWGGEAGTYSYDTWLPAWRGAGANFIRLWLAPWSMGLEHTPGTLNRYDLAAAWHADHVMRLAESHGLHVVLSMDHHGMFMANDPAWGGTNNFWTRSSPYASENGGPCASPNEFFTRPEARRLYEKRLRYLIGRYGSNPFLLSWQFFNEIDNAYIPRSDLVPDDVTAWHRDMARWLRAHDPHARPISTSLTGASDRPGIWELPEMDFAVYHSYGEADPAIHLARLGAAMAARYDKPVMIGEYGTSHLGWNIPRDPYLRGLRQGIWGGALGGSVGTSMAWWWEDIHDDAAYPVFGVVRDVMMRAGLQAGAWMPAVFHDSAEPPTGIEEPEPHAAPFSADIPLNQLRLNRVTGSAALPDAVAVDRAAERLSAYLHGSRNPQLQQHARLTAWFASKARVLLRVNSVAADADLLLRIDGAEALREPLKDRDGLAALNDEIDREFVVDVPAGRHTVEIAHTGVDWVNLRALRVERIVPTTFAGGWRFREAAIGLRRGDEAAVVYVRSPYVAWPAGATRYNPPLVRGGSVVLTGWGGGAAAITWIDPVSGRDISSARVVPEGTRLELRPPEFREDLIALVRAE